MPVSLSSRTCPATGQIVSVADHDPEKIFPALSGACLYPDKTTYPECISGCPYGPAAFRDALYQQLRPLLSEASLKVFFSDATKQRLAQARSLESLLRIFVTLDIPETKSVTEGFDVHHMLAQAPEVLIEEVREKGELAYWTVEEVTEGEYEVAPGMLIGAVGGFVLGACAPAIGLTAMTAGAAAVTYSLIGTVVGGVYGYFY